MRNDMLKMGLLMLVAANIIAIIWFSQTKPERGQTVQEMRAENESLPQIELINPKRPVENESATEDDGRSLEARLDDIKSQAAKALKNIDMEKVDAEKTLKSRMLFGASDQEDKQQSTATSDQQEQKKPGPNSLISRSPVAKVEVEKPKPKPKPKVFICYQLGPLKTSIQMKKLKRGLEAMEMKVSSRMEEPKDFLGHWVYIEPSRSRALARLTLEELKQKGVKDIALVTRGAYKNAISLGVFRNLNTAQEKHQLVTDKGYKPLIRKRYKDSKQYWLLAELEESRNLDVVQWDELLSKYKGAKAEPIACL